MENIKDILKVEGVNAKGYGIIGKLVMQDKRLTIEAKAIYAYFRSYAGAGTSAFPGVKKIVDDLGISENRYYRHLKLLKEFDYIRVEQIIQSGGKYNHNIYTLVDTPNSKADLDQASVIQKPYQQYEDGGNEKPSLQNDGTVEEVPHLQNEGTGQKAFPSLHFPCTENEGTNINNILLKLTDIYNNLSFYQSNIDTIKDEERELLKLILSEKNLKSMSLKSIQDEKKERIEGKIEKSIDNKGKRPSNEFRAIVSQAQLDYCEDGLAAEQALRLLYFSDKSLMINNIHVPPSQVREDLKRISIEIVNAAFNDFYKQSKNQRIRNPVVYLSRCIYNAIWHSKLKLNADMNFEGINY